MAVEHFIEASVIRRKNITLSSIYPMALEIRYSS